MMYWKHPERRSIDECRRILNWQESRPFSVLVVVAVLLLLATIIWMSLAVCDDTVRATGVIVGADTRVADSRPQVVHAHSQGIIKRLRVIESQLVRQNEILLELDATEINNRIDEQQLHVESTHNIVESLERNRRLLNEALMARQRAIIAEREAAQWTIENQEKLREQSVGNAKIALKEAVARFDRIEWLRAKGAASLNELEAAEGDLNEAQLNLNAAMLPVDKSQTLLLNRAIESAKAEFAIRSEENDRSLAVSRHGLAAARAALAGLRLELARLKVRSPVDGVVTVLPVRPGDYVTEGAVGIIVAPVCDLVCETQIRSSEMAQIRVGLPVLIELDRYDKRRFPMVDGRVTYVAPDSESITDADGRTQAAYRVRIAVHPPVDSDSDLQVTMGMRGVAHIVVERKSLLMFFVDWLLK